MTCPSKTVERVYFHADLTTPNYEEETARYSQVLSEKDGNLISSLTLSGDWRSEEPTHAPTLDIDGIPVRLLPSSTPGNFHLYIDKRMPWSDYVLLLSTLGKVGILEKGYVNASIRRGASFLRKPGVTKQNEQPVTVPAPSVETLDVEPF